MSILITGAAGQVGQDLVRALIATGETIHATDLAPPSPIKATPNLNWHRLDVTDSVGVSDLIHKLRPQKVFHLAALLSARGENVPQLEYQVNQTGTWNILEACRQCSTPQLIFPSSIAAFGPGLPDPTPDDAPTRPTTMYGITKVSCELLGEYYHHRHGLDFRAVRFPGLISAAIPGGGTSDYALFMYLDAIRYGKYAAYCRPDTRIPLMYMPDAIAALLSLSSAPADRLTRRVYNIAAFSPSAQEIAASVRRTIPNASITFAPDPARQAILDSWPCALDDSKARQDWDWQPRFDLESMTADLIPKIRKELAHV